MSITLKNRLTGEVFGVYENRDKAEWQRAELAKDADGWVFNDAAGDDICTHCCGTGEQDRPLDFWPVTHSPYVPGMMIGCGACEGTGSGVCQRAIRAHLEAMLAFEEERVREAGY